MHVLLTRPREDAEALATRLEAAGHSVAIAPLITVEPAIADLGDQDAAGIAALAATSRNAIRALAGRRDLAALRRLRLYAVGPGTATLARAEGFADVVQGDGAARELAATILADPARPPGVILHLTGDVQAFDLAAALRQAGIDARARIVYRTLQHDTLPPDVASALGAGSIDAVVLMSPRTARAFTSALHASGLAESHRHLWHLCLSATVARGLPATATKVEIAAAPRLDEMLALLDTIAAEFDRKP